MTARLHPDDIEAIARRVVALQREHQPSRAGGLVDVKALASHLSVSTAFVYEHAAELGGVKLADTPKAPWRFDLSRAEEAMRRRGAAPPHAPRVVARRPRVATTREGIPLLPIKGLAA
ncbi:MAG: hypothetical protein JHC84_02060 [Solirubrobacteraceae bacterium]|nr:hypothetical protein [Solirubrobacteraceae bacterium]